MLRSVRDLDGYIVVATDGEIGGVYAFYFNDLDWNVRYLVVDTGTWLPGRRVLVSAGALGRPDAERLVLPVRLTKSQVENSPPVDADKPVSRQMEARLHDYYGWPPYWGDAEEARRETDDPWNDPHLRSTREVTGYGIQARDGQIGQIDDWIVEDEMWVLRYLVVDTGTWLPGRRVLVAPAWVEAVDWSDRLVHMDLKQETIENSPEFDPAAPVNREYEGRIYDYYGRPTYW